MSGLRAAALSFLLLSSTAFADALPGESYRNHLVLSLGVGIGTLNPSEYNQYVTTVFNPSHGGIGNGGTVSSELHVPILFTYYGPYWILIRSGAEAAAFTFPGETILGNSYTNYGGTLEIPIEFGGHYSLLGDRLILELAAGPAIAGYSSAGLSPNGTQFYANPALGFDSELKAQYFLSNIFSLGLEIGYRVLSMGPLHDKNNQTGPAGGDVNLDMSGFRAVFELGFALL